jgi:predicted Rossmann fold nucleotide-binding protein DprA/Smf involved in DNA uptake
VTNPDHLFEELAPDLVWTDTGAASSVASARALDDCERAVLQLLDDVPVPVDRICAQLGMTFARTAFALTRLEVRGLAVRCVAGYELSVAGGRVRHAAARDDRRSESLV